MHLFKYVILITISLLITGCTSLFLGPETEAIRIKDSPADFHVGYQKDFGVGNGYIREFIPQNESIDHWQHLVTIYFLEGEQLSPLESMHFSEQRIRQKCKQTTWEVLSKDISSILYEWSIHSCLGQPDQHEIVRLMQGNDGLHRISYTENHLTMNPEARKKWLTIIKNAYLTKGDSDKPILLKQTNN